MGLTLDEAKRLGLAHLHPDAAPAPEVQVATATRWIITLDGWLPPSVNRLLSSHWAAAARLKKATVNTIRLHAREVGVPVATGKRRVSLRLTVTNRSHAPDPDNVWKAILDGCKRTGLLIDDRAEFCEMGPAVIEKGPRKQTVIVLEDI